MERNVHAIELKVKEAMLVFVLLAMLVSGGCFPTLPDSKTGVVEITLYAFSVMKESLEKAIYPAFAAKRKREHGEDVRFISSFAGSELTIRILFTCIFITLTGTAFAQTSRPAPEEDTQIWNDLQITLPLHKRVDLIFNGQLRIGRDVSHLVDERAGAAFAFKAGKYVTLSPGYTYIATQPVAGQKGYENRLLFVGTVRFPLGRFTMSDRNQFERRLRDPVNSTRYRNRLQIEHPVKIGRFEIQLFVFDEVFNDWSADSWVRNRFALGGSKKVNERFTIDVYYLRQNDGRSRPGDLHVLGTALKVRL